MEFYTEQAELNLNEFPVLFMCMPQMLPEKQTFQRFSPDSKMGAISEELQ